MTLSFGMSVSTNWPLKASWLPIITIDPLQPGKVAIATWYVLAQLGSLGIFSPISAYVLQHKYYNGMATSVPAPTLADDLDVLPKAATVILFSEKKSHTDRKERYIRLLLALLC